MNEQGRSHHQVFVSYAHADDLPMDEGVPGWVSSFVDKLSRALARHANGALVDFWMDHSLEPQRKVTDELKLKVRESAVILAFISPRYLVSPWCQQEMATFVAEVGQGIAGDRVFLVEVLPTQREQWDAAIRDLTPVTLWTGSMTQPAPRTKGWPVPDPRADRDFWDDVNRLAGVLARQLQVLPPAIPAPPPPAEQPTPVLPPPSANAASASEVLNIVVHAADDEDSKFVSQTQALLGELDVDAYLAPGMAEGQTPAQHRAAVEGLLRTSHGVLVVYGSSPPTWVQAKHVEVRKLLALERPGACTGVLEGPPEDKPPHGLPPRGLMVLDCRRGLQKEELSRFVQFLRQQRLAMSGHV
ncbi:toll/interleukin-1 receptor domain-containing protein [Roseateles sp. DB2]|uniref:toll/interleukin-1 receptor domain-containing protein n=1 Tax=Roseateles sp. DB2 TaxID=3453717 RepID=UPI003EE91A0C